MSRTRSRGRSTAPMAGKTGDARQRAALRPRSRQPDRASWPPRVLAEHGWEIALVALVAIVALNLGALDWFTDYPLTNGDGSSTRLPNTFASVDHPFHINKERAVLDAIRNGEFPRWFSNHQAGYPAEFYPLGADLVVVTAWALGLGLVPLEVIHKLVVIGVLFIPIVAYWAIARRDGWPLSVALIAALLHLFLPGSWLGGGPDELLRMGMWPNVFATYLTLPLVLWSADYLRRGSHRGLVLAAGIASLAIYANPRATIAVGTVLLAVGLIALLESRGRVPQRRNPRPRQQPTAPIPVSTSWRPLARRSVLLTIAIGLLCAGLLVPLRARQGLYEFSHFVEFDNAGQVWEFYTGAVPIEVIVLAVIGAIVAARRRGFHGRVLALWLPLALLVIVVAGWVLQDLPLLAQLEGPRLIPLLRPPTLFLAAVALHEVARFAYRAARGSDTRGIADIAAVALVAVFVLTPVSPLAAGERGLPATETTNQPAFTALARSAELVERLAASGDRPLIVGSPIAEQASFWIPALSGVNAFHSAWVWYWRTPDYADRTRIADVTSSLELEFLRRHGLSLVLIATNSTDTLKAARTKPYLTMLDPGAPGGFAIFRVQGVGASTRGPVSVTNGEVKELDQSRERLIANVQTTEPTEVRIAINDYPAWRATVNGRDAPIRRSVDGYMLVNLPAGNTELILTYTVEPVVWIGRTLVILGVLLLAIAVTWPAIRRLTRP